MKTLTARRKQLGLTITVILACGLTLGCGQKDDEEASSDPLEGVWKITSATENPDNCDAEGPATEITETHFKLSMGAMFPGMPETLLYNSCTSPTECSDSVSLNWAMSAKTADGWSGYSQSAGGSGEVCTYVRDVNEIKLVDGKAVLESRQSINRNVTSSSGKCESSGASYDTGIAGAVCSKLEVIRAERVP